MAEKVKENLEPKPLPKKDPQKEPGHVVLLPDDEADVDLKEILNDILFVFYSELEGKKDFNRLQELIDKVVNLSVNDSQGEKLKESYIEKMKDRIISLSEANKLTKEEAKKLLKSLSKNELSIEVSFNDIDVNGIKELVDKLNRAIESKDLKEITKSRGRLIRKLKKEDSKINEAYTQVEYLAKIDYFIKKDDLSSVKKILEEHVELELYFSPYMNSKEEFINSFNELYNRNDIQLLVYLENLLSEQLEKHKSVLNERYSNEFLDKKGDLKSIVTVLPNAIGLSIKKVVNSINEIKAANTNRRKIYEVKELGKDLALTIGTPVIYFGKFLASNWYSLYMTHKLLEEMKETKLQQEQEEKARKEAEEAKKRAEEAERRRLEEEAKRKAEEAKKLAEEEAKRKAEEEARRVAEEEARKAAEEEARRVAEEEARKAAEEEARRVAEEEARKAAEEEARRAAEEEARRAAEEEARRAAEEEARRAAEEEARRAAEEEARRAAEEEARRQAEQAQVAAQEAARTEQLELEPEVTLPSECDKLVGSNLVTMFWNASFGGNISEQLESGLIDGDTPVKVNYLPKNAQWYEFWKIRSAEVTLRQAQILWNWSPEINFDDYEIGKGRTR